MYENLIFTLAGMGVMATVALFVVVLFVLIQYNKQKSCDHDWQYMRKCIKCNIRQVQDKDEQSY